MYKKAWCTWKVAGLLIFCRSRCRPRGCCLSFLLLANNSQRRWMLYVASVCTPCCVLLGVVVAQSLKPVKLWTNNSQHLFVPWSPKRNATMIFTALPTLLGPRTRITHGLQSLIGCILPTMHCRSQHCWQLLYPFTHHCQRGRNNSQHCWPCT